MDGLKKLIGAYLIVIGAVVAVFFIIDPFLVDSVDVLSIWSVVDVLMVIASGACADLQSRPQAGRVPARLQRTRHPQLSRRQSGLLRYRRRYDTVSAQLVFAIGIRRQPGGQPSGLGIWAAVNTLLPLVLGVTGCRLWLGESDS